MILLFQAGNVSLGPTGTILLTALAAVGSLASMVLAVVSWKQRTWKSTADAAVAELGVHKQAAERLRGTCADLTAKVAKLEAQTDLKPLIDAVSSWVIEGRARFDAANSKLSLVETALRTMLDEMKAQRSVSEDAYRSVTTAFMTHTLEDKEYHLRFVNALDKIERRLSEVAVRVGVDKWQEAGLA